MAKKTTTTKSKKTSKKTEKRTTAVDRKGENNKFYDGISFGTDADEIIESSQGDERFLKLENEKGANMVLFLSDKVFPVSTHWLTVSEGRRAVLCGSHRSEDYVSIIKGFSPDDCAICQIMMELYQDAKQNPTDPENISKKEIANSWRAKTQFILWAVKGEADSKRGKSGKRIYEPFFQNVSARRMLSLTSASFYFLREQMKAQGFTDKDLVGMPVNFMRGVKGDGNVSQVTGIEFYPNYKIPATKLPVINENFASLGHYGDAEMEKADKLVKELEEILPELVAKGLKKKRK